MLALMEVPWLCLILAHHRNASTKNCYKNSTWRRNEDSCFWYSRQLNNLSKKVNITLGPAVSTVASKCIKKVNSHKSIAVGKDDYDLKPLKQKYGYFSCIRQNTILLSEVEVLLGQNAFSLTCSIAFKSDGAKTTWAVKLLVVWPLVGSLPVSEKALWYSVDSVGKGED